jgi:hypothetical protein
MCVIALISLFYDFSVPVYLLQFVGNCFYIGAACMGMGEHSKYLVLFHDGSGYLSPAFSMFQLVFHLLPNTHESQVKNEYAFENCSLILYVKFVLNILCFFWNLLHFDILELIHKVSWNRSGACGVMRILNKRYMVRLFE